MAAATQIPPAAPPPAARRAPPPADYPVNSRIFTCDVDSGVTLSVSTDRAQGGSSIEDGSVERWCTGGCSTTTAAAWASP